MHTIISNSPASSHISAIVISTTYNQEIAATYTNSWSDTSNTMMITYLSLSCGFNVYLTAHIVVYMVQSTRKNSATRILCNQIASMFVQSTLLYLVPTLVFIALCAERNLGQNLLFPLICQIQVSFVSHSYVLSMQRPGLTARWIMCSL